MDHTGSEPDVGPQEGADPVAENDAEKSSSLSPPPTPATETLETSKKRIPTVSGPLGSLRKNRTIILARIVARTTREVIESKASLDLLLSGAVYSERSRMRRIRRFSLDFIFTSIRYYKDKFAWKSVFRGLLKKGTEVSRKRLLQRALSHYAEEIGGRFNPKIYEFVTHMVPYSFNWLLSAASVKKVLPVAHTQDLDKNLKIVGNISSLRTLATKGTILMVPTHLSNIDSLVVGYSIYRMSLPPFSYGAGLNLYNNPVFSFFMKGLGAYTVDRQKTSFLYKKVLKNYSTEILKRGIHSVFFPGGGRARSGAIESKLKLGLLGTGLQSQIENYQAGKAKPKVFIVPMVMSYDFVVEALSLVEDYLQKVGQERFMGSVVEDSPKLLNILNFLWKFAASKSEMYVRLGQPMDVFGNWVDDDGQSIGPNGTWIDPKKWLTTRGELRPDDQRDREYTLGLSEKLVDRFYKDNTVLCSHAVAFVYCMELRKKYPDLDLYRFLRLSPAQRSLQFEKFLPEADRFGRRLRKMADKGQLFLSDDLKNIDTETWVRTGAKRVGILHDSKVVKISDGIISTEDLDLLYYYRNRLSGYGFSLHAREGRPMIFRGGYDEQGFLA